MRKKTVSIKMITAEGCEKCREVLGRIVESAKRAGVVNALREYDSSTNEAVELGIAHGLSDVPSFVVGNKTGFSGIGFKDLDVDKAMKEAH